MTHEDVAGLAAAYALGALADDELRAVEAHLRKCPPCARLVGAAEGDVALIASMEPRQSAPPELARRVDRSLELPTAPAPIKRERSAWPLVAALAAALIVGFLPSAFLWQQNQSMHNEMLAQSAAMGRLASERHRVANFRDADGRLAAKVMYALDGSWYLVVVPDPPKTLQVVWMHDGERTMLGKAEPRGDTAMLYLPKSHRMDRLALTDGVQVVAEAELSWKKTRPNRRGARSG